jgi:uncharacterized membrane protein
MSLIRSFLIGCATGLRSITPLAVLSAVHRRSSMTNGAPATPDHRVASTALIALAVLEAAGDKLPFAPDRIAPLGLAARAAAGGLAGAALAPWRRRAAGAVIGAASAIGAAYLGFNLRRRAMRRFGQVSTGLLEDAISGGAALWLARGPSRD